MSEKRLEYVRQTMDQFLATLTAEERLKEVQGLAIFSGSRWWDPSTDSTR